MGNILTKRLAAVALASASVFALATPTLAIAQEARRSYSIPTQDLASALEQFGRQSGKSVMFDRARVAGARSKAIAGTIAPEAALRRLLQGTGFTMRSANANTFVIEEAVPRARVAPTGTNRQTAPSSGKASPGTGEARTASSSGGEDVAETGEIIVTAQKRTERLQDVPVPVTAIRAEALVASNQSRIEDFYTRIPGLNFTPGVGGVPSLSIRGITTGGFSNPTVGITINDVPFGGSTALGGGFTPPDIDPSDLERVEVLRGPQGTLYGASSIGGLMKFVTVAPSTESFSGRVQLGVNGVHHGDGVGHSVSGAVNMPVSEELAVRISAYHRGDPGYINDPVRGVNGTNEREGKGGHFAALFKPSEDISLSFGALIQDLELKGSADSQTTPGFGALENSSIPGIGGFDRKSRLFDATLVARLGAAELTSITAYGTNRLINSVDVRSLSGLSNSFFGVAGAPIIGREYLKKFTHEVRISVPLSDSIDWIIGGFYTDESVNRAERLYAADSITGAFAGLFVQADYRIGYEEIAAFSNLTVRFSDRLDLQLGARRSSISQSLTQSQDGVLTPGTPGFGAIDETKDSAFTYLVTPRFKLNPDVMLYARLASGYRPGGPNYNLVGGISKFAPDKTYNYELGIKGNVFDRALDFDLSIYLIDWKDIQLRASNGVFNYIINGPSARSKGVEFTIGARPAQGISLGGYVSYNDAELAEDLPPESTTRGSVGDPLPGAARWTFGLHGDAEFPVSGSWAGFIGGNFAFVDKRVGEFRGTGATRELLPSYVKVDLRAGVRSGDWTFTAYINNLFDERGVIGRNTPYSSITYIQPRTIGISAATNF